MTMNVPTELDGAKVLKHTPNDASKKLSLMFFEEKGGSTTEVAITALAIAQYEEDNTYYLFMCDKDWTIQDDQQLETIEEAEAWAEKNFDVSEKDWN
ncbi:hypothetical protein [Paenisporosarcina indica]|uniref:hypothetical protein n=1 Tax=Paenisporosarcina indica TaxID=650093 RepID=UPI000A88FFC3|nr:hypothetical protein [Paenisporosarcina indica]